MSDRRWPLQPETALPILEMIAAADVAPQIIDYVDWGIGAQAYREFLANKVHFDSACGFDVDSSEVNPILKPHQRDMVVWAVKGGRRALFAAFGLGKSVCQLEWVRLILSRVGGMGLIVMPLNVAPEFVKDAQMLGIPVKFVQSDSQIADIPVDGMIYLTNYESVREGKVDAGRFHAISLDEAAFFRSFGKTKMSRELRKIFEDSGIHRLVATATPSPNEYIELLAYAAFLDVGDVGQMKTRFFKRNSEKADKLTLHPHKEEEFWIWVSTWALFIQKPSDLGYSDEGYDLPPLKVRWHEVPSDLTLVQSESDHNGQASLMRKRSLSAIQAIREKKAGLPFRMAKVEHLLAEREDEHCIVWHDLEAERAWLEESIAGVTTVFGSQPLNVRYPIISDFANGKVKRLGAKPEMLGCGCNLQRFCSWAIYAGITYDFTEFIQSVHRIYRFLQPGEVSIDIVYTEAEISIREALERKWEQHKILVAKMTEIIREYGLNPDARTALLKRNMGVKRRFASGENWWVANNDSILETALMEENSVGLILTSIPFGNQYEYSANYADLGHTDDTKHFWQQMSFLIPNLLRILKPGRDCVIHVKDRITPGGLTGLGYQTVDPFHADAIAEFKRHGFTYLGMHTVGTDVVRENAGTYRLGWTEQCKDGSRMGCGMPEYLLLFRKPQTDRLKGYADEPVVKDKAEYTRAQWQLDASGTWLTSGERLLDPAELRRLKKSDVWKIWKAKCLAERYDYQAHVDLCQRLEDEGMLPTSFALVPPHSNHPDVWTDIFRAGTMNQIAVQQNKVGHICPLQFDICDRIIRQRSEKGDVVYDPFSGVGTVPIRAVKLGRFGAGSELSPTYWLDSVGYLRAEEARIPSVSLFDWLEAEDAGLQEVEEDLDAIEEEDYDNYDRDDEYAEVLNAA